VLSPLLSNIYLHKLDVFAETVLMPEYTRGNSRADNPEYRKVESQVKAARRKGDRALSRSLGKRLRQLPSQDRADPGYRRLRYVRYADLCRPRHKSAYADIRVMPTGLLEALPGGQVVVAGAA
jgi:hypothetical protein